MADVSLDVIKNEDVDLVSSDEKLAMVFKNNLRVFFLITLISFVLISFFLLF
jgi:hypothetical protein